MRWMVVALSLVLAVGCAPQPQVEALQVPTEHWGRNLVANPGFEQDADGDGRPDGWNLPEGQCAWETAEPGSGKHCLRFTNANRENYRLVTAPVAIIPGVRYRISAWVRAKDVRDGDVHQQGAGLCIEWMDAKGKWLGGHYPSCKDGTFGWTKLEGETGPVPETAASGHVVVYLRKQNVGTAWFDDVEVKAIRGPLLSLRLLKPAYRATVEAPAAGKPLEVQVGLNRREHAVPRRPRLQVSVADAEGRPLAGLPLRRVPAGDEAITLTWRLPSLPVGRHTVVCRLFDRKREVLGEAKTALHVARPARRKVTLDERGRLIVEGKPFFPLGLYLGPTEDEHLERIAKGGFNTILCYGYGVAKEPRAYLDRAQRHGLKVVYSIKDLYEDSRWYPKRPGKSDLEQMQHYVTLCRDHPAVIAWYTNDELGPKWMPKLQAAYDLVCELDPDHPTLQVLCSPRQFHLYYGVTDILGCDPYPIPRSPVTMVGTWMETAHAGMCRVKPVWCVPQIFQWGVYRHDPAFREPTFAEKRAMIFLALIHRAQGLICYSYYDLFKAVEKGKKAPAEVFQRRWREVSSIAKEVKQLIPVLLDGREVGVSHDDPIRYRALEHEGVTHILAVNTDAEAESDLAIPVPRGKTARRVDTDAEARIKSGKLMDRLKPLETAIYEVR